MTKRCPGCGHQVPVGSRFCMMCGAALTGPQSARAPARTRPRRWQTALLSVCLLLLLLSILTSMVLPRVLGGRSRSPESTARATLEMLRGGVAKFKADTGVFPASLSDLAADKPPKAGIREAPIDPKDWKGPYVRPAFGGRLPPNDLRRGRDRSGDWIYNPPGKPLGTVVIDGVPGLDSAGKPYSEW